MQGVEEMLLVVLRGKITALEKGYEVGIYDAAEVKDEAKTLLEKYPDIPEPERARLEALKKIGRPTRGKVM